MPPLPSPSLARSGQPLIYSQWLANSARRLSHFRKRQMGEWDTSSGVLVPAVLVCASDCTSPILTLMTCNTGENYLPQRAAGGVKQE